MGRKKTVNLFYFKNVRHSLGIILFALIPVVLSVIVFQVFVNRSVYTDALLKLEIKPQYNIVMLLYYLIIGIAHIIISIIVAWQFALLNKRNMPSFKMTAIKKARLLSLIVIFFAIYLVDLFGLNISFLSHERLYLLMQQSDFYKQVFLYFPDCLFQNYANWEWFRVFSILPFLLICVAVSVMIYGGFYIGNEINRFLSIEDWDLKRIREKLTEQTRILRNYAQLLSIVMVSSTIATILFFLLPIPLIKDPLQKNEFMNVSFAMGICWGVIFSLTLLFLCIYPYKKVHDRISILVQMERVKNDPEHENWLLRHKNHYTFSWNFRLIVSILSPAATGILATLASQFL